MRRAPGRGVVRGRVLALLLLGVGAAACGPVVELEYPAIDAVPKPPPEQSVVLDADGNQLAVLRREFRERVALDGLPDHLVDAVLAAEDRRFRHHRGIDARAIVRAALRNVAEGEVAEGGSTITQQLVKNLYLPEAPRTPETKLQEALIAREVEQRLDKDQILEEYLNTVYFGSGAYGVEAAAQTYWRKPASALTLAESALLAGIIRAPESLNPHRATDEARSRRDQVLEAMVELGWLDAATATDAADDPIVVHEPPPDPATEEPRWVAFVVRYLLDQPGLGATEAERAQRIFGGGLRIHTTLRPELQRETAAVIDRWLPAADHPEAAVVLVDPATGHIPVAVGGREPFDTQQFDLATQAERQPGSTFKAFVLAAAISSGWHPGRLLDSTPGTFDTPTGPWRVRNYSGGGSGLISLEDATVHSVNAAYARLILELGPSRVAALARAMGIEAPVEDEARIALGGLEVGVSALDLASSFGTLANLGEHVPPTPVARIDDADGDVVWRPDASPRRVLEPSAAFVTTEILRAVVERGTGTRAQLGGWEVAGKTGTVQDNTDAWFVGYTPVLATAVWVGHPEGRIPMRGVGGLGEVTGGTIPARIFRDVMALAHADLTPVGFRLPIEHYEMVELDPETGLRTAPWCPGEITPVPRVLVPRETCPSPAPTPRPTGPVLQPAPGPGADGEDGRDGEGEDHEPPDDDPPPCATEDGQPAAAPRPRPEECRSPSESEPPREPGPEPSDGGELRDPDGGG